MKKILAKAFYLFVKAILCVWDTVGAQKMGQTAAIMDSIKAVNEGVSERR